MKVLHILDHSIPLHSGYTFRTRSILEQQRALGIDTVQLTSCKHYAEGPPVEEVDGLRFYRTHRVNPLLSRLPVLNQWEVIRSLRKRLAEVVAIEKPDILHAHSPSLNGSAALAVGAKQSIPVVYECRAFWEDAAVDHGTIREGDLRYRVTRALETSVFRRADAVTVICEGLRKDIAGRGIPADKITVIPNAVNAEKFSAEHPRDEALAESLGLKDKRVIGFIGSFYAYEGLNLLVDALPEILSQTPDCRLLLVGGGPREEQLKAQCQRLGLTDKVIFTGRVPHDEVKRYYGLVDLFVYPRISMRLTDLVTPLKPLEAMAQRKLVLASDVGGHHELIRDGENGFLFQADSADDLAKRANALFAAPESWAAILDNALRYVHEERTWNNSVSRYPPIYERLLQRRGG
ncbi:MAG TPA: glycosyltransferase, exosortase A system-associated [Chromatiaceae bacterium]|nr:glycosyltransferase, exosortase A system-associated [Chromatiaceae bacterium]